MISKEKADEFLKQHEIKELKQKRLEKIEKLPEDLKYFGKLLLDAVQFEDDDDDQYYWGRQDKRHEKIQKLLLQESSVGSLYETKYAEVVNVIFDDISPNMCTYLKTSWNNRQNFPYQQGWSRRSFKAPNNPEYTLETKIKNLTALVEAFKYDFDIETYTRYLGYHAGYQDNWSHLLAAIIDSDTEEGKTVLKVLLDTVYDRDDITSLSRTVIKALLMCDKSEAYEAVEKLLISAQRQEGLRQTVLESLDETTIASLKRIIRLIIDNKLARFSAVVRAVDTWFGFGWEAEKEKTIYRILEEALLYIDNEKELLKALKSKDNLSIYIALWAKSVHDINETFTLIKNILETGNETQKLTAFSFLQEVALKDKMCELSYPYLSSDNNKILAGAIKCAQAIKEKEFPKIYTVLEKALQNVPVKNTTIKGVPFEWSQFSVGKPAIYSLLLETIGKNGIERIIPELDKMDADNRWKAAQLLFDGNEITPEIRKAVFMLVGDRSEWVWEKAFKVIDTIELAEDEIMRIEELLTRKSGAMRKTCIKALMKQSEEAVLKSGERLLSAKNAPQRSGGLDLLKQLKSKTGNLQAIKPLVEKYKSTTKKLTDNENILVEDILSENEEINFENALGLINPNDLTVADKPQKRLVLNQKVDSVDEELQKLNDIFEKNKNFEYEEKNWDDSVTMVLLGNSFPGIPYDDDEVEDTFNKLPLLDILLDWWKNSPINIVDVIKILAGEDCNNFDKKDRKAIPEQIIKLIDELYIDYKVKKTYTHGSHIIILLRWIRKMYIDESAINFMLDACETLFASVSEEIRNLRFKIHYSGEQTWRNVSELVCWFSICRTNYLVSFTEEITETKEQNLKYIWKPEMKKRLWHLLNYDQSYRSDNDNACLLSFMIEAEMLKAGEIHKSNFYREMCRNRPMIWEISLGKSLKLFDYFDFLEDIYVECRNRIVEVELNRGDSPTLVSDIADAIHVLPGIPFLIKTLKSLEKEGLQRSYAYSNTKKSNLSSLVKAACLDKDETQKDFDKAVNEAEISRERLIEVGVYNTELLSYIEKYLKMKGMEAAVWWFKAHTKDSDYSGTDKENSKLSKFTPLTDKELTDGAVDVDWFKTAYKTVGKKNWNAIYNAAKYIAGGVGHKRAQLFADSMLGVNKIAETRKMINEKRRQDYMRALGLLPLSKKTPEADVLNRYQLAAKFLKESKQYGSQRQESEKLSVRICLENLARTAAYSDPIRLTWAMETKEAAEIIAKAKSLTFDETTISLSVDEQGKAHINSEKTGKKLKSIPAKYRKKPEILNLQTYKKTLTGQYSRTRKSLENALTSGDAFTFAEIQNLLEHPVVAPMLKSLVLTVEKDDVNFCGFMNADAVNLTSPNGNSYPLTDDDKIRIAHCVDLNKSGDWSEYQHYCFDNKLVQPFKQIFRELYLPTEDEKKEKTISRRYAGNQVQPRKTVALLKTRGWTVDYDAGLQKVYHKEGFIASIYAVADWFTPSDVESPTLETVEFTDRTTCKTIEFEKINPIIFSEIMRDVDLVVSTAHAGGVDPEASHSTIEMRTALIAETFMLLGLKNVKVEKNHAFIEGCIGNYSVHLGSGVVHRQPGGYISILPVHSSHRGRIFLPFVDNDPKSAEIISKILLLSEDNKIKDPTILSQLNG